jgi:hypothetical protein
MFRKGIQSGTGKEIAAMTKPVKARFTDRLELGG